MPSASLVLPMKPAPPLLLLLACAALAPSSRAEDPGQVNAGRQNAQLSPGAANVDTGLSPSGNLFPFTRDDSVQDKLFPAPDEIQKQMSALDGQKAPFDFAAQTLKENTVDRKNFPQPTIIKRQMSPDDGDMFRAQPGSDPDQKFGVSAVALKYQDSLDNAHQVFGRNQVTFAKTTTFDKLNKFLFRRNGPENGGQLVTPAGGGSPAQVSGGGQTPLPAPIPAASLAPAAAPAMPSASR